MHLFAMPFYAKNAIIIYQDRLGTNIGRKAALKKGCVFLQAEESTTASAGGAAASGGGGGESNGEQQQAPPAAALPSTPTRTGGACSRGNGREVRTRVFLHHL